MSKLHDPDLMDSEKPLYVFEQEVICDRLIDALEYFYEFSKRDDKPESIIHLVPSYKYFISYNNSKWAFSEKVYITQEQVDKYLILYDTVSMPFLEYMEILHEG